MKNYLNLNQSYLNLPNIFYDKTAPTKVSNPKVILYNTQLAKQLNIDSSTIDIASYFSGNLPASYPNSIAQAYAGHQYAHFTMLGDGRAILLGELRSINNETFDIQLKGSGRTKYSRGGDGRATLPAMLREYIISEALAGLNIPGSRSLAVVTSNTTIYREDIEQATILTRVAKSHIRVGTFEFAYTCQQENAIKELADYVISKYYPNVKNYQLLYHNIIKKQAKLIAKWQLVGFVHGVMNTDNMSITGESIDFGPCAFLDKYIPKKSFSSIDRYNRYSYWQQPIIAEWNLEVLGTTMQDLFSKDATIAQAIMQEELAKFKEYYHEYWLEGMKNKLGLSSTTNDDEILIQDLLTIMEQEQLDFTNTFVYLTYPIKHKSNWAQIWNKSVSFQKWFIKWQERIKVQADDNYHLLMENSNPRFIARNHLVEQALYDCAKKDDQTLLLHLLDALQNPYTYNNEQILEQFQELPPSFMDNYYTYCGT